MSGRRDVAGVEGTFHPTELAEYIAIPASIELPESRYIA